MPFFSNFLTKMANNSKISNFQSSLEFRGRLTTINGGVSVNKLKMLSVTDSGLPNKRKNSTDFNGLTSPSIFKTTLHPEQAHPVPFSPTL